MNLWQAAHETLKQGGLRLAQGSFVQNYQSYNVLTPCDASVSPIRFGMLEAEG